jgi:hypothetical protein
MACAIKLNDQHEIEDELLSIQRQIAGLTDRALALGYRIEVEDHPPTRLDGGSIWQGGPVVTCTKIQRTLRNAKLIAEAQHRQHAQAQDSDND